jgi:biopolymer transport protein ExbD
MQAAPRFTVAPPRRPRRANLTPMIDVLFLLVVFFLLAARFEAAGAIAVAPAAGVEAAWSGPPRLVTVTPDALLLNGRPVAEAALAAALAPLVSGPDDMVVLRAAEGATLQRLVAVIEALGAAGFGNLALVE